MPAALLRKLHPRRVRAAVRERVYTRWPMLRPPPDASSGLTTKRRLNYYLSLHEHLNRCVVLRSRPTKLIIE
jgi:hypothetical protein